ncbi:MAG: type I-A CRISPR-associated protein Cas5a [Thermoproteota archaeon]
MKALLVEGLFHWGFSVRVVTESAGAISYHVPPPSTLMGALAYGLVINRAYPEVIVENEKTIKSSVAKLKDVVKWATFAFVNGSSKISAVRYSDFIRSFRLPYQRGVRHEEPDYWYGISASGKVYALGTGFKILYFLNTKSLEENGISDLELFKAAYSIIRLGAKEGIISITGVSISKKMSKVSPPINTDYYFPCRLGEIANTDYERISLPIIKDAIWEFRPSTPIYIHEHEEYYIPKRSIGFTINPFTMKVKKLSDDAVALKADFENMRSEIAVVPVDTFNEKR